MDAQKIVQVLASQLDGDGMNALGELMKVAAAQPAQLAAQREQAITKLASDLVEAGFEADEVVHFLDKVAEEEKLAEEVHYIKKDCEAMGAVMGKTAFDTFIGLCADHVKTAQEDEEDEKEDEDTKGKGLPPALAAKAKDMAGEGEEKEDEEDEDEEEEKEKEAQVAKLAQILSPFILRG